MTENKVIELLKNNYPKTCKVVGGRLKGGFDDHECDVGIAIDLAINALEEVQQYRAIGTIEECRAAVERQNPRAAITEKEDNGIKKYTCYACGRYMGWSTGTLPARYCWKCGQKLDWGDEE